MLSEKLRIFDKPIPLCCCARHGHIYAN
jgi:hypothetical protein